MRYTLTSPQSAAQWRYLAYGQEPAIYLDSRDYPDPLGRFRWLVAWGKKAEIKPSLGQAWASWQAFVEAHQGLWVFSALSYELKDEVEPSLHSKNPSLHAWPLLHAFCPEVVVYEDYEGQVFLEEQGELRGAAYYLKQLVDIQSPKPSSAPLAKPQALLSRAEYLARLGQIRQLIREGDCYELNFCQAFAADNPELSPQALFEALLQVSANPFSAYYRSASSYLLCASPERFLAKRGQRLISQPIKGTCPRGQDQAQDKALSQSLLASEKNRAENVMIVDLVRNDLARSCLPGTVEVPELFGIYAFPQVFQMISTVSGLLAPGDSGLEALRLAFPMGSMTGAPKVRTMQRIEALESYKRGIYSGAVGYIAPEGDFDFNVVIRSFIYQADTGVLSFEVGGAIVYDSEPEDEYQECLLKAEGLMKALARYELMQLGG